MKQNIPQVTVNPITDNYKTSDTSTATQRPKLVVQYTLPQGGTASDVVFTYNGDGQRVKSVVTTGSNTTTTYFIGAHYEVTNPGSGQTISKYYFAGAQRIAMRKYTIPQNMTVEYFLNDHLGSTSITTDNTGAKVSEMRYKPWGETRYTWTSALATTPAYELARYTFTGQYSYTMDFGLLFYNARMYDPTIGRFAQADSIVPGGVQGWDRYAYVNNDPVRYTDPSGHIVSCEAEEDCTEVRRTNNLSFDEAYDEAYANYGVSVESEFSKPYKIAILLAILRVGQKFASEGKGETAAAAFRAVYKKGVTFVFDAQCDGCRHGTVMRLKGKQWVDTGIKCTDYTSPGCVPGGGVTTGLTITFASLSLYGPVQNVVHELGHVYDNIVGASGGDGITPFMDRTVLRDNPVCAKCYYWQQHPWAMDDLGYTPSETFADIFVAWTYNAWSTDPNVGRAQSWMGSVSLIP